METFKQASDLIEVGVSLDVDSDVLFTELKYDLPFIYHFGADISILLSFRDAEVWCVLTLECVLRIFRIIFLRPFFLELHDVFLEFLDLFRVCGLVIFTRFLTTQAGCISTFSSLFRVSLSLLLESDSISLLRLLVLNAHLLDV